MIAGLRRLVFLGAVVATTPSAAHAADAFAAALDAQWDFGRPAVSEQRFRAELARWPADSPEAQEVRTQVARALGLQRRFDDARALLDTVETKLATLPTHVRVRYLLERGRTLNSSGAPQRAVPLFADALTLAERDGDEYYAVDAAHMLGIAAPPSERRGWDLKALALAEAASDPRARGWRASLYNNLGWANFDDGDPRAALDYWQKALSAREMAGNAASTRVAKWTVARGYRAVGRLDDAEALQKSLLAELDRIGETDGYVYEELAEIALARGDAEAARPWAAKAHAALKDDPDLAANDARRLARLAAMAADGAPRGEAVNPQKRRAIFERLRAANPHPQSELAHRTPFELLVAVVLSAQATDKGVNKATERLFPIANTPAAIVALGVDGLIPLRAVDRPVPQQGEEHRRAVRDPAARARRRGAGKPGGAGKAARRGTKNRQRRAQRRVRATDDRRGHAHLPGRQPHGARPREKPRRSRAQARQARARRVQAARAPLADPARPLRLRRAQAGLRRVRAA